MILKCSTDDVSGQQEYGENYISLAVSNGTKPVLDRYGGTVRCPRSSCGAVTTISLGLSSKRRERILTLLNHTNDCEWHAQCNHQKLGDWLHRDG